jgi:hypothetical protein
MARNTEPPAGKTGGSQNIEAGFYKPTGGLVSSARTALLKGYAL